MNNKENLKKNIKEEIEILTIGNLAVQYYYGRGGVRKNYKKAFEYALKSYELNETKGLYALILANCYFNGFGVEKNYEKAVKYYNQCLDGDSLVSQAAFQLSVCFAEGLGVKKNLKKAKEMFLIAYNGNYGSNASFKTIKKWYEVGIKLGIENLSKLESYLSKIAPTDKDKNDLESKTKASESKTTNISKERKKVSENKIEVLDKFFKKYVFVPSKPTDNSWVDGASMIVKGYMQEVDDATIHIQNILDYFTISGDSKNIDSYKKIREFFKDKNNDLVKFILNLHAQQTELSYLETLTEYIENYKKNRQTKVEEIYDFCADNEIDTMTIYFAGKNLLKIKSVYLKLPKNLSKEEKLSQLRFKLNKLNK